MLVEKDRNTTKSFRGQQTSAQAKGPEQLILKKHQEQQKSEQFGHGVVALRAFRMSR